jgi:hypothetical protein
MVTELAVIPLVPPPGLAGADPAALDAGDEPAGAAVVDDELADFELLPHPAATKATTTAIAAAARIRERCLPLNAGSATFEKRVDFASLRILSTFPRSFRRSVIPDETSPV